MSDGIGCICAARSEGECCCDVDWTPQELIDARAEIKQLRAERDALKKDAERYRWLRKNRYMSKYPNSEFDHAMHLSFTVSGVWVNNADPDVLDACIDTAMEESK